MKAADFLASIKAATPKQQAVLDALRESGWEIDLVRVQMNSVTFGHPDNEVEIPTPDYAREEYAPGRASYPFETYTALWQLTILFEIVAAPANGPTVVKLASIFKRERTVPWVGANDQPMPLGKAAEWIRAEHPAREAAARAAVK